MITESYFNKKTVTKNVITTTLPRLAVPCSRTERTTMLKIQCMRDYFWRHMYMHVCNIYAHITKSINNFISLLHPIHTNRLRHIWYYLNISKLWSETNTTQLELRVLWNGSPAKIADNWLHKTMNSKQAVLTTSTPLNYTHLWSIISVLGFSYAVLFLSSWSNFPSVSSWHLSFSRFPSFLSSAAKNNWKVSNFTFLLL